MLILYRFYIFYYNPFHKCQNQLKHKSYILLNKIKSIKEKLLLYWKKLDYKLLILKNNLYCSMDKIMPITLLINSKRILLNTGPILLINVY